MIFYYFTLIIICIIVIVLNNLDMNQQNNNNKYFAYADIEDLHNSMNIQNLFNYIQPDLPKIQIKRQETESNIEGIKYRRT